VMMEDSSVTTSTESGESPAGRCVAIVDRELQFLDKRALVVEMAALEYAQNTDLLSTVPMVGLLELAWVTWLLRLDVQFQGGDEPVMPVIALLAGR
jgi:hypothetical protein